MMVIICSTGTAVLFSKYYMDNTWWSYTEKYKCIFYSCESPVLVNITNASEFCIRYNVPVGRCSYFLEPCSSNTTMHTALSNICVISSDELASLFCIGIWLYSCVAGLFTLSMSIHFIRAAKRIELTDENVKYILTLDFLCGLLHATIIFLVITPIVYAYVMHESSLFIKPLLWINVALFVTAGHVVFYYIIITVCCNLCTATGLKNNEVTTSNKHSVGDKKKRYTYTRKCFGSCCGICCGTLFGKLFVALITIGILISLGYLIYRYAFRKFQSVE